MAPFDEPLHPVTSTHVGIRIAVDGGTSLAVPTGQSRLVLDLPELRALDLRDSPDLVELDVSAAAAAFHLTVTGCPRLDRVKFPTAGSAIVHLDSGSRVPELVLEGGVAQVDACWAGGTFLLQAEDGAVWDGAHIGRLNASGCRVEFAGRGLGVWVGTDRAVEVLVFDGGAAVQTLAFVGLGRTRQLVWTNTVGESGDARALYVLNAPALETIEIQRQLDHLVVEACPEVNHIVQVPAVTSGTGFGSGNGSRLDCTSAASANADEERPARQVQIRRGSGAQGGLTVNWHCDELIIVDSSIEHLTVVQPCELVLQRNWKLDQVSRVPLGSLTCEGLVPPALVGVAQVHADRGLLRALVERFRAGDTSVWPKLESTLAVACDRNHAALALQALVAVCEAGLAPAVAWPARMALYARHLAHRGNRVPRPLTPEQIEAAKTSWAWGLATDLAEDGWRADWAIWLYCVALPDAADYSRSMIDSVLAINPATPANLLSWLFRQPQNRPAPTQAWLAQLCRTAARPSKVGLGKGSMLRTAVDAFLESPDHENPAFALLYEAAFEYTLRYQQPRAALEMLERQLRDEKRRTGARLHLLGLLRDPPATVDAWNLPWIRSAARTLLLTHRLPV